MVEQEPIAVYIHFPYCKSRCPYCDFFRALKPRDFDEKALVQRYSSDLKYFSDILGKRNVKSVFFGGGTPSLLSSEAVSYVLEEINQYFHLLSDAEISLEANPNTFDQEKFIGFHNAGINRLSLGVQALNTKDLKFLGRTHSIDEAIRAMETGVQTFPKFSIDLIYGRPHQQWDNWQQEIDFALSFGLKHISLYQLTIEEGTVFYRKNIEPLGEEDAANLYEKTVSYLRKCGFERYEVSNFAVNNEHQCKHNLVYWQGGDYIGIGEGAHGRIRHDGNIFATVDGKIDSVLSAKERAEELLLMGLRIKDGIDVERFKQYCGLNFFDFVDNMSKKSLAQLKLLCYDSHNLKLTDIGFLVLDKVILDLID